ncbi:MAG: purine-nucleoside phosphorylase [Actinobacteria bacterium]|nr:MAG: purine-nucleoside phosphorylase [Actinomycetota bacterium]
MEQILGQIKETANYISNKCDVSPEIGVILGSGFSSIVDDIKEKTVIAFDEIPHFAHSTTRGHPGNLVLGKLSGKKVIVMQGRFHFYEGYTMWGIGLPIRVFKELGVKSIIITCSAGAINPNLKEGDIMVIKDHINLMPENPLVGPYTEELGPRFPNPKQAYSAKLQEILLAEAKKLSIKVKNGVYIAVSGPSYETAAEIEFMKKIGADAVGMSVVPEVLVANQAGIKTLAIAVISNSTKEVSEVTHEKVLANVSAVSDKISKLLQGTVKQIDEK